MPLHPTLSRHLVFRTALLLTAVLSCTAAQAANDIFLRIAGITGDSKITGHVGDIELQSFSWGVTNIYDPDLIGKANRGDLTVLKRLDRTSPQLMLAVFQSKIYPSVTLFVRSRGTNPLDFVKITLTGVAFSSYQPSGASGEDQISEAVSIAFQTIRFDFQPQNPDGTAAGGLITAGFDIARNVAL